MASPTYVYNYDGTNSFHLSKWKIRVGSQLFYNSPILSYKEENNSKPELKEPLLKYKSNVGGTVTELLVSEGDIVQSGVPILKVQPCTHPVIMKDLCAECGTDLRSLDRDNFEKLTASTTFSMVHVVPELKVSLEQAEQLGRDDEDRLLKNNKLVLLVDLDQTLIHTTNDNVLQKLPGVCHFQLYGSSSPWYHTKLRPGTKNFLENISKYYELHICTFGARLYAHKIAKILDPDGKFFSHRILSRDECFDATSKTANLKALFPRGDHMVCIIDDREDVWNFAPNVIHVKPYTYFRNTGDINAPPFANQAKEIGNVQLEKVNDLTAVSEKNVVFDKPKTENSKETESIKLDTKACKEEPNNASPISELSQEALSSESKNEIDVTSQSNLDIIDLQKTDVTNSQNTKSNSTCDVPVEHKTDVINCKSAKSDSTDVTLFKNKIDVAKSDSTDDVVLIENKIDLGNSKSVKSDSTTGVTELKSKTDVDSETNVPPSDFSEGDDYLLYLEEILIRVHKVYYDLYKKGDDKKCIPDLKSVVPEVRKKVLKKVNIVFSSVIPTNCIPESDHFWKLAESLGASVTRELVLNSSKQTTHVVASKSGTAKVNAARRHNKVWVVTLDWLLCCEDRWERADERMFPLPKDASLESENVENAIPKHGKFSKRQRNSSKNHTKTEEEKFSERVFAEAGLALSQDEIEDMDREIEEACSEESDEESQNCSMSSDSSSAESLSSGDYPKGWKKRRKADVLEAELLKDIADDSSDVETIGSVDEEMAEAVKQEFQDF